jgi:hypothetical protein
MQPEQDETAFNWIRSGRSLLVSPQNSGWSGNFVSHLMPPIFEAYAKVLHPIEAYYENIDNPLSAAENLLLNIPTCEELKSFVERRRTSSQGIRIKWRELAELLNVPFTAEIFPGWFQKKIEAGCWPRFLKGPDEGWLDEEQCSELVSMLNIFEDSKQSKQCFFRFAEIPLIATDNPLLFKGTLDGMAAFIKTGTYQFSPEYWWPSEKTWCVCSDYDLEFTVVGGPRKLISMLLMSSVLECLEVTPQTRIDWLSPMP